MTMPRGEPASGVVGSPVSRVDGRLKVTGAARYSAEIPVAELAYGVIVQSEIAQGAIEHLDTSVAEQIPGVIAIMTSENTEKLESLLKFEREGKKGARPTGRALSLLQDSAVHYNGQPIAVVIAQSFEVAMYAASLVRATYRSEVPTVDLASSLSSAFPYTEKIFGRLPPHSTRGDVDAGLSAAEVRFDQTYTTPMETHNPMEMHATTAAWDRDKLTLWDSTQNVYGVRGVVANTLGIPANNVRVISHFIGGAFGGKGSAWSHVLLAAMAARLIGRPVKLMLTRRQMFGPVGGRPATVQHMTIGTRRDGTLTAIRHATTAATSTIEDWLESSGLVTRMLYECPNVETTHHLVRMNVGTPTFMRAPGEATGSFALECALDEVAYELDMDPIALRLKNYADADPESGKPWSSKGLEECYALGADRIGWSRRNPKPRSMRDGEWLVGVGMATATYPARRLPASAEVCLYADGRVIVKAASHDLGTGTYTILTQLAADALGVAIDCVSVELGDTNLPPNPISAGSMTVASTGSAVHLAAMAARYKLVELAVSDPDSPLYGTRHEDIVIEEGCLTARGSECGEAMQTLLARHGGQPIEGRAEAKPGDETQQYSMHSFGAVFVEVRVDPDLGTIRIAKVVGAYGAGRVLNPKTARSQMIGGITFGIGMALMEHTVTDLRSGRYVNADIAEYHIPVHADVPPIEILFVDERDPHVDPIGAKGIGEIGMTGVAAAIANAVYHATGLRVRDLPITLDRLLVVGN
ncbi:MAG TPA: xanthine dehydrogenase family protein molybdopterin-binding subunit [Gemmatimonadaceae bacterium]|nr:xanthine dehydrogenase family protein molybdopterin-binding subunit [Gemmatimonadaceae bacterium]